MRVRVLLIPPGPPDRMDARLLRHLPRPLVGGEVLLQRTPIEAFRDPERRQIDALALLDALPAPPAGHVFLALCGADLFVPALTHVFGISRLGGRVALLSWHRLLPPAGRDAHPVLERRLRTEALHELGHALGLVHCAVGECAMHRALWAQSIDLKSPEYCPTCLSSLRAQLEPTTATG